MRASLVMRALTHPGFLGRPKAEELSIRRPVRQSEFPGTPEVVAAVRQAGGLALLNVVKSTTSAAGGAESAIAVPH